MERRFWRDFDVVLLLSVLALIAFSLPIIGSSSSRLVPGNPLYYVKRELIWAALGLGGLFLMRGINYEGWRRLAWPIYGFMLALLAAVLVHGHQALGAQRWIQLGPFPLQPSEIAKLLYVLFMADYLTGRMEHGGGLSHLRDLAAPAFWTLIPMLLVLKQPDLGTALVFAAMFFGMLYVAGSPGRLLLLTFGGVLAVLVVLIYAHLRWHLPLPLKNYQLTRLLVFLNPNLDPLGSGYNIIQSKVALGSGGLWGTGLSGAWQNHLGFLPEPYTDFIFAVIGEETGFIGAGAVLLVYLVLLWRSVNILGRAKDRYGAVLAAGIVAMFAFHLLVNAGMAMGIMPVTGVPLPFISYGGSSLLTNGLGVGLLLAVYNYRQKIRF